MEYRVPLRRLVETLDSAAPDAIHEAVITHIEAVIPGSVVDMLVADYSQRHLRSLSWPHVIDVDGSAAGRAYMENSVVAIDNQVWAPLNVDGACLGVLSVTNLNLTEEHRRHIAECAVVASRWLVAAERATSAYRRVRSPRMTLAAELQWSLLPGRGLAGENFTIAGQLEPALSVRGDTYDWSVDGEQLTLVACNGMGEGMSASLLSAVCLTSLRNGRRSGLDFEDQLVLANDSIWSQYGGKQYSEAVVLSINTRHGTVQAIDAGSPRLYRQRDGRVQHVSLEQQLPLGMFDGTRYSEQRFKLRRADRLLIISDGVMATPQQPTKIDDATLRETLTRSASLTPTATVRAVIDDVVSAAGTNDLVDDAVVVCLDWQG